MTPPPPPPVSYPSSDSRFPNLPPPSSASTISHFTTSTASAHKVLVTQPISLPKTSQSVFEQNPNLKTVAAASKKRIRREDEISGSPAKKQSRWSEDEDAEIIRLKNSGMKWEDISKKLTGRSAISCRLHYQNYLKKRDWEDEKRNKLAQVYNRLKNEVWSPIAIELGTPWRECEAMFWAIGEEEMARRAKTTIAAADTEPREPGQVGQRRRALKVTQVFESRDPPSSSNHEDSCTPRSAYSQQCSFPEASNETFNHQSASPSTRPGQHPYGCFRCKKPRALDTCDGWKRHMKEHETVFPCRQCEDSDTARNPWSYTRKANLVKHLSDTHKMSDSDASAQADTWCETVKRKYFGCGFCVSLFYNITDQLNHIDTEHFRRLQDISGWDTSKVIQGLTQQPGVNLFWQNFFGASYPRSQDFTWNDSVAKNLQLRLELSEESAEDLATAAISQVIWTEIPQDSDEASVTGGFTNPHMEMDQNMLSVQDRSTGDGYPHGGNFAFTPVNIPPINSPLHAQKNVEGEEDETLPGFTEFIMGANDLARRGR